jgi:hypothetical protein
LDPAQFKQVKHGKFFFVPTAREPRGVACSAHQWPSAMTAMSDSRLDGVTPSDFVLTFQHHKIPDWHSHYLDYASFLQLILRIQVHAAGTGAGEDTLPHPFATTTTPAATNAAALQAPLISAADGPPSSASGSRWSGRCQPSDFDEFLKSEVRRQNVGTV